MSTPPPTPPSSAGPANVDPDAPPEPINPLLIGSVLHFHAGDQPQGLPSDTPEVGPKLMAPRSRPRWGYDDEGNEILPPAGGVPFDVETGTLLAPDRWPAADEAGVTQTVEEAQPTDPAPTDPAPAPTTTTTSTRRTSTSSTTPTSTDPVTGTPPVPTDPPPPV